MARQPNKTTPPAEAPKLNEAALATLDAAPAQLVAAQEAMDEVLAAGVDLGRLEALTFIQTVSESAALAIYENVKKSKAWRLLRNPKSSNGLNFASLDEFCQVKLGRGYARMQMLLGNQRAVGEEAFEQAERLGLHQRDYNAIKALPAPDQEMVRRAVEEAKTREEVLDVLHDLAVRSAQQKAALEEELQDANDQVESLAEDKRSLINEKETLRKQARRLAQATPDEVAEQLRADIEREALTAQGLIQGPIRDGLEQLQRHSAEHGTNHEEWMAGQLAQLERLVRELRGRLGVKAQADGDDTPEWMRGMQVDGLPAAGHA